MILQQEDIKGYVPEPKEGQCHHFNQGKQRYCKMQPRKGQQYCGDHVPNGKVACPYTDTHTIAADKLKKHMFKCPFRIVHELPSYHRLDVNVPQVSGLDCGDGSVKKTLVTSTVEEIKELTDFVKGISKQLDFTVNDDMLSAIEAPVDIVEGKHPRQTHALVSILHRFGMIPTSSSSSRTSNGEFKIVEFGCGKGDLSAHLASVVPEDRQYRFLLVDRDNMQGKKDNMMRLKYGFSVDRLRMDIKDLDLGKYFNETTGGDGGELCCISKHLCGAATDLTLSCLFNEKFSTNNENLNVSGIVIALCCHHRCSFDMYCNHDYLKRLGIDRDRFSMISSMCSWATSGHRRQRVIISSEDNDNENEEVIENENNETNQEWYCEFGFESAEEKRKMGWMCKRILDMGRVEFIKQRSTLKTQLGYYISEQVSLENVALIAK